MKFFLPHAGDATKARHLYTGIREFLTKELGAVLTEQRIFGLTYVHENRLLQVEVGEPHPVERQTVDAIFFDESVGIYYICTRSHGVTRGHPIVVNAEHVEDVVPFDD